MAKILTVSAMLLALAACSDPTQTAKSAAAGAMVGAGANYLADEDPITGAAIGAVGGAVVEEFVKN